MPLLSEPKRLGDVVKFEDDMKLYSRDQIVLITGQNLLLGTVLGLITASGKLTQLNTAGADGSQLAVGVLIEDVNATAADVATTMVARFAIVSDNGVIWPVGITAPNKTTAIGQLKALGILVRAGA
jgi:Bacteriophage lambda head decoration protein D